MTPQSPKAMTAWPDPTPEMLKNPFFEAIWQVIKKWDVNVPHAYSGYCGATGNHARAILEGIAEQIKLAMEEARAEGMKKGWQIPEGIRMAGYNKGFSDGQVTMRERAAKAIDGVVDGNGWTQKAIRALKPKATEDGK
jgi:hypothetical protein